MLGRLRFRYKLMMFPGLASVAFLLIVVLAPYFAQRNEASIDRVRKAHVPALQTSLHLLNVLERIQRVFQDAAAAENMEALVEADLLRDQAAADVATLRSLDVRDASELAHVETRLGSYYALARRTTERLIRGDLGEGSVVQLRQMTSQYNALKASLEEGVREDQRGIGSAFSSAVAANNNSMYSYLAIVILALILMGTLAWWMTSITMKQLGAVSSGFKRMSTGDFSTPVDIVVEDELGDLGTQLNLVGGFVKDLARQMQQTSADVNSAATALAASARVHQQGASEQSSAVSEIRKTMESTVRSVDEVTSSAATALQNAEHTQDKNLVIANGIRALSAHTDRIGEILENIKDIANKSELLALNAALEGTKAGEAGRGFSLVATQMQRLAENVIGAVRDIKRLTVDIRAATTSSVAATEQGAALAKTTTDSARQIRAVMQQHRSDAVDASRAIEHIVEVARSAASHSEQVLSASRDLAKLSEHLVGVVARLTLEREAPPRP